MSAANSFVAVPSKGRLQENANAFFARAGLELTQGRGARDYRGAHRRARQRRGRLSLGLRNHRAASRRATPISAITGEDLVREEIADAESKVELLTPLGFGHANVVVAVPQAWIDVRAMADLADVADGFPRPARARHARRDEICEHDAPLLRADRASATIASSKASARPKARRRPGQAELIVDITTTGATLAANALKVLDDGVILRSQANLVASLDRALERDGARGRPHHPRRASPPRKRRARRAKSSPCWTRSRRGWLRA